MYKSKILPPLKNKTSMFVNFAKVKYVIFYFKY